MKNKLILVRSFPGSGKSSFVRSEFPNIFHLENDFFHYHNGIYEFNPRKQEQAIQWCIDTSLLAMSKGMDIVISNTFTKKIYIDTYVKYAKTFGYDVEIYRMMGDFDNVHGVSSEVLNGFKKSMQDYEGEIFVYPIGGYQDSEKKEYIKTTLKVGDKVVDNDGNIGTIQNFEVSELYEKKLYANYKTEDTLFNKSELKKENVENLKISLDK